MSAAKVLKPLSLAPGARLAIVSPASPLRDASLLDRGVQMLRDMSFSVEELPSARAQWHGYLAGDDALRAADLNVAFTSDGIDAIVCTRGGYGSARLFPHLSVEAYKEKSMFGFSDITALSLWLWHTRSLITYCGYMAAVDHHPLSISLAVQMARGEIDCVPALDEVRTVVGGIAEGRIVCVNLAMLTSLCGTAAGSVIDDCILVLEDIGEAPYRIDRMLLQLEYSGWIAAARGIVFGCFTGAEASVATPQPELDFVLHSYARRWNRPCIQGMRFGHVSPKVTLPFGCMAVLDAEAGTLTLAESPVRQN